MLTSDQIRKQFIDYFVERCGHTYVPSAPVVPHDDPTLLFTNAGMNQFKDVFLGVGSREYTRAANTQKCIRAGGKHNDLEDVGKDTYHHTFFEMLGNWSFGDYFKKEAIGWAWELLTGVWGLEKKRLHVTVFGGNEAEGLARDDEAAEFWRTQTDVEPAHIHYGSMKDNFWEMGETGPCGPCSEIHIDLTDDYSGKALVNAGDARVIEIWNLVFIQFNRDSSGKLTELPAKHVDTGMGFERLCAVLQGKKSNYDTDVFKPLFDAIQDITGAKPYGGKLDGAEDIAYRVIADHIRTLTFALTDGAVPSNEGRGYVLRRILRRAVRYGRQTLNVNEPFFHRLVSTVVESMGGVFGELKKRPGEVAELIREEEELFSRTLDRGIALFEEAAKRGGKRISGADAFELYATYGFPLDLTQLMAGERGMTVDTQGFNEELDQHRAISRGGGEHDEERASLVELVQRKQPGGTKFVGDRLLNLDGVKIVMKLERVEGRFKEVERLSVGVKGALVVDQTPFYAEAGGQVGDRGYVRSHEGAVFKVEDTIKVGDVYFHLGQVEDGNIHKDKPPFGESEELMLEVEEGRRQKIMAHHTTTHIMNHKLRAVLGDHVQQKGSLVDDEKTRFDFSHTKALTDEQIQQVEQMVNADIAKDLVVHADVAAQKDAMEIHGLRAVFGEKYPPMVRVVSIGPSLKELLAEPHKSQWMDYSVEFCGGTHLAKTGDAEGFVIVSEEAVAKGVRRVTAVAGKQAHRMSANAEALLSRVEALMGNDSDNLAEAVMEVSDTMEKQSLPLLAKAKLRAGLKDLGQRVKAMQKEQSRQSEGQVVETARRIAEEADEAVIVCEVPGADGKTLRTAMDVIRQKKPESALLLAAGEGGKVALVAAVPEAWIRKGLKAGDWVKEAAKVVGGSGGGRPEMAQAGGTDVSKINEALEAARAYAVAIMA